MKEALVEYVGRRRGKFTTRMDRYPIRTWAAVAGRKEQWLPVDEAELWDRQRDWMITRTRVLPDAVPAVTVQLAEPAPPAKHVSALLKEPVQQVVETEKAREPVVEAKEQVVETQFCISDNGVAHKWGCAAWPKYPLKLFDAFADAADDEDFNRAHKLCCKAEMVVQRGKSADKQSKSDLKEVLEEVEGGLVQMNTLGESYGIQAKEA